MIEFKAEKKPKIAILLDGQVEITFTATKSVLRAFEGLNDKPLAVTVKEHREKRSLSQNSYLWVLLDKLAVKLKRGKEDIYKEYIRDYGVFEIIPVRNDAAERFIKLWQARGLGWVCEDLGESKLNGYTKLIAYYGSSTYTSKEIARLIDAVIQDCAELGIQVMPLKDIMLLQNDND
jgi:hypothetical protein